MTGLHNKQIKRNSQFDAPRGASRTGADPRGANGPVSGMPNFGATFRDADVLWLEYEQPGADRSFRDRLTTCGKEERRADSDS